MNGPLTLERILEMVAKGEAPEPDLEDYYIAREAERLEREAA